MFNIFITDTILYKLFLYISGSNSFRVIIIVSPVHSNSLFIIQPTERCCVVPLWNELDFSNFVVYTSQADIK